MDFQWNGGTVSNVGELADALCALPDAAEGGRFMREYVDYLRPRVDDAEAVASANVGYVARYCDDSTYERIIGYTAAVHPVFGDPVASRQGS